MANVIRTLGFAYLCLAPSGCCKLTPEQASRDRDWLNEGREFGDYSSELTRWRKIAAEPGIKRGTRPFVATSIFIRTGTTSFNCYKYLQASNGFVSLTVYFDAKTEAFESMRVWTDAIEFGCPCGKWWPRELCVGREHTTEVLRDTHPPTSRPSPTQ